MNGVQQVFSAGGLMPQEYSYVWDKGLLGLDFVSDVLIAFSDYTISITILYFVRRINDIKFMAMSVCFAVFVMMCGTIHALEVWTIWPLAHWFSGGIKALAALVSVSTAIIFIKFIPKALGLPGSPRASGAATASRRAERERDQFFELSQDLFSISDLDGRYKRVNRAWEKTLGYSPGELIGQLGRDLIHPEDTKTALRVREEVLGGAEAQSFELRLRSKVGGYHWILGNSVADEEQGVIYFSGRDITRRKTNEQEIQTLNAALHLRAEELESMNGEVELFSCAVTHDLRAPLRHIGSFTKLLAETQGSSFDASGLRYLGIISGAVKQMGNLIDDVLAFSRVGRTALSRTAIDSDVLVADIVSGAHYAHGGRAIKWEIRPLGTVHADAPMLRQVWVNLIENAVKYSSKTSHPHIIISGTTDELAHEHLFSVRDNGVGFDMALAGKLFSPFQRLHGSSEFEGTGFGLANVRRIVSRHGGRTWAEGTVGEGAIVSFSLPFLPKSSSTPPSNSSLKSVLAGEATDEAERRFSREPVGVGQ